MYQSYDENGDQRFFAVLLRAIEKDGVVPFSTVDDRFTTPLTLDEVNASLKGSLDTQLVQNVLDPNVYDTSIIYNTNLAPNPDSIYTFRLKEQWIFDSKTSRMYSRIIGIAPIQPKMIMGQSYDVKPFWLKMDDCRPTLAKAEVFNRYNDAMRLNWDQHINHHRLFDSYIVKTSEWDDRYINQKSEFKQDGLASLLRAEEIKNDLFIFEHDLWEY
jgi:gliding motility associated protien GldN